MIQLEVGKSYRPTDAGFDPITIIKRTNKCVFVRGSAGNEWRMTIKNDGEREYVTDSCVPARWRYAFTYFADNEYKGEG